LCHPIISILSSKGGLCSLPVTADRTARNKSPAFQSSSSA